MNSSKLIVLFLILEISTGNLFAQNRSKAFAESSVTWYGVDYSLVKFTLVTESTQQIVTNYLPAINAVIVQEQEKKYNIRKFFNKSNVTIELDNVNEHNQKIDPAQLALTHASSITQDEVNKLVKSYKTAGKKGMGLVFVAENMNKSTSIGSFYVVFFDLATKEIIDSQRFVGKAGGIGFRNFWAGAVYEVMKVWASQAR
jgi:hypothetical protein